MASRLKKVTATGKIIDGPVRLKSVVLAAGSDAATAIIDDSTDGAGTDLLKLVAPAGDTAVWTSGDKHGVYLGTAAYTTLTGTGPHLTIEYEP